MQYDVYFIMYKPLYCDNYYPTRAFNTLEAADKYIDDKIDLPAGTYYVDILTVYSE